ncbi:MAG: DUF885 domain-containing protein [Acidobacteriaceae bacterium]
MKKIFAAGTLALSAALLPLATVSAVAAQTPALTPQIAQTAPAAPASLADRRKALSDLFNEIWQNNLKQNPEFASSIGDKRYNDQLTDYSVAAYNDELARERGYIDSLAAIDTTGMTDQEKLSKQIMLHDLINNQEEERFKEWEMPVNQFNGLQLSLPQLVPRLTFDTIQDYDDYITRLTKVPTAFSQIMTNMMIGMDDNRTPPKYLMEKVLVQVNTLASQKAEDSPFALPLKKFPKTIPLADQKRITQDMLDAINKQVLPTYRRFAKFVQAQYIPKCRLDPGVWSLPDGDAYYAFLVRQSTTLDLTPAQIHQIGIEEVKKDEAQMLAIAQKLGYKDLKSFSAAMKANPKLHPTSGAQLLDAYRGYINQMRPKLPQLFGRLPKAPLEVLPVPAYMEKDQATAYYMRGSPDGKRPGRVYVNTYNFTDRSLADVEAIAYHEGLPGHHLQISIAQELTGLPQFRKYTYYTAYTEGWGLYSEQLGKDVGFYTDPYSDYGRLEGDIWRAIRLVVDTGVHYDHWTRQQMVDYFHDHSTIDDTDVQSEVDRYIAWPAQALGYKIGQLDFLQLRAKAKKELGPKFDIRAFHDELLDSGALPLDLMNTRVDAWISQQKAKTGTASNTTGSR